MNHVDIVLERYGRPTLAWSQRLEATRAGGSDSSGALTRDLFRGSLLWGAVGDAMGRPFEGWPAAAIVDRIGRRGPRTYEKWRGWCAGPTGTITDDTQLTMAVAESLVASRGVFDEEDFIRRLVAWLPQARGAGRATTRAIEQIKTDTPWHEAASTKAAGNGAAMRAAPIGLVHAFDPTLSDLVVDAVLFSAPTHGHPAGVAGAAVLAAGVGYLVRSRALAEESLDVDEFIELIVTVADALAPDPVTERRHSYREVTLGERLRQAADVETDPEILFDDFWSGAFIVESLPCAINAFLRSPDDPMQVLHTALRAGHDVDTIASMAGNLAGAWTGADALRRACGEWWAELEDRDRLIDLADGLFEIATGRDGSAPAQVDSAATADG